MWVKEEQQNKDPVESEIRYRRLFEATKEGILIINAESGEIEDINPYLLDLLGYSKLEVLGKQVWQLGVFKDKLRSQESFCELQKMGYVRYEDLPLETRDGRSIAVEFISNVYMANNEMVIQCNIRDITQRKKIEGKMEGKLKETESLLNKVGDIALVGGWEMDLIKRTAIWTKTTYDIVEIDYDAPVPGPDEYISYYTPRYQPIIKDAMDRLINQGEAIDFEAELKTARGNIKWCHTIGQQSEVVNGRCVKINGTFQDITRRKGAERELELRALLLDNAVDSIFLHKLDGKFIYVNEAACQSLGYLKDELLKLNLSAITAPGVDIDVPWKQLLDKGQAVFESAQLRKNGSVMPVEVHARTLEIQDVKLILSVVHDIAERKIAEAEISKSYVTLKKTLNDAINTMAKIVEMRDPYTAGHQQRVAKLAIAIAKGLNFNESQIEQLRMAATVHDIGKIYVPSDILNKPGKLSDIEFQFIKTHCQGGYDIVNEMEFPQVVAQSIIQHHERINGSGYPNGLMGEDIIIEAKIIAVADVVESIASHRPYRETIGIDKALEEITKNKGILYDAEAVEVCVRLFEEEKFDFEETQG